MSNTKFSLLFYLKRPKNNYCVEVPVYLRITVAGKRSEVFTGLACSPEVWNRKSGRQDVKKEEVRIFNSHLDHLQSKVYESHRFLVNAGEEITSVNIKRLLLSQEIKRRTLLDCIKIHNQKMKALIGRDYAVGTWKRFQVLENHVSNFINDKYQMADINIRYVDRQFIADFDFYLRVNKCANNTTIKYLKNLGKILRIALGFKWIDSDPLMGYKLKSSLVERSFLSGFELKQIMKMEIHIPRLMQVKDVFIFCCFTGLAYSDVEKLNHSNIQTGVDGKKWIYMNRTKTSTRLAIPILPPALAIIEKYADEPICLLKNKALPVLSNQKMNDYLKEIAKMCNLRKPLSTHIARHTFATTVALVNGVPVESVSKLLGHTNIKTTQIYAKVVDTKLSEDMANLKIRLADQFA